MAWNEFALVGTAALMIAVGTRVVVTLGTDRGQAGTVVEESSSKRLGARLRVLLDDGSTTWSQRRDKGLVEERTGEGAALVAEATASLGPPDVEADLAFARDAARRGVPEIRRAIRKVTRHRDARVPEALLSLASAELLPSRCRGKPDGWLPSSLLALSRHDGDPMPAALACMRAWGANDRQRRLCSWVARSLVQRRDPRLLAMLQELGDASLFPIRLELGDPTVYAELASRRIVLRDGQWQVDVGDLEPTTASRMLEARSDVEVGRINLVRGGQRAFAEAELGDWLAWSGLRRFESLDASAAFVGAAGVEALVSSPNLSPSLRVLDVSECDVGHQGCSALGRAATLTRLRALHIDRGRDDQTKWTEKALQALFPGTGGVLHALEHLSIRGWNVKRSTLEALVTQGRAPALRTVETSRQRLEVQ